jgi:guanine deaminase
LAPESAANARAPTRSFVGTILSPGPEGGLRSWPRAELVVQPDGRIAALRPYRRSPPRPGADERSFLPSSAVLIPGLVDAHTHLAQYPIAGQHDGGLQEWLERYAYPAERAFADPDRARRIARLFFRELARGGTTCASVFGTVHAEATHVAFEEARSAGLRICLGKVVEEENAPSDLVESGPAGLGASDELCARWNGAAHDRLRYAYAPRYAPAVRARTLRSAAERAAARGAALQTHLAETRDELGRVRARYAGVRRHTDPYRRAGWLRPGTVFAHGVYLDATDRQRLAAAKAGLAHCPASNLYLGSGFFDAEATRRAGVPVGLGSDIGAGPETSVMREMGFAGYNARALGLARGGRRKALLPRRAFEIATLGGARALGLADRIGTLTPGRRADFVVVDCGRIDPEFSDVARREPDTILSLLMYRADKRAVLWTYVDGRSVYDGTRYG